MNRRLNITLLVIGCFPSFVSADVSGKVIAFNCYSCHGKGLKDLKQSQTLSQAQLVARLLAFKRDAESSSIMNRISKGYTDYELASVAAYIKNGSQQIEQHDH